MNPKDTFKNRPSITEAKAGIVEFFKSQKLMHVSFFKENENLVALSFKNPNHCG